MQIRDEKRGDEKPIFDLTTAAFEPMPFSNGSEPVIVDRLRVDGDLTLSLVAIVAGEIAGHIAFSPVTIDGVKNRWFGLGPVSVAVDKQRKGIGSALIREGLNRIKSMGANGCVLVGNPAYYGRFGFQNDGKITYGEISAEYVQWLAFGETLPKGAIEYSPAFTA